MEIIRLPLDIEKRKLYLNENMISNNKKKLEAFLIDEPQMHTLDFAKSVLLTNEVKSNNSIEGYYDDIQKINDVVFKKDKQKDKQKNKTEIDKIRILNLFKGYNYILNESSINKFTLKKLYSILSDGLLTDEEESKMGEFYRLAPVYIYYSSNLITPPIECIKYDKIDYYMNELFDFINQEYNLESLTDEYIKSQIMHFYFVYIHPYFDINGRTSRTMSIWHLLNKKAYPYVIFNRGIILNKQEYYKVIMNVRKYANMTDFINYMLKTVLVELQKEHVILNISNENKNLTNVDLQSLHYILSMNGLLTLCDFSNIYNKYNKKRPVQEIYKDMIMPLIDKEIIIKKRQTSKKINHEHNFVFELNKKYVDDNPIKTGELKALKK